MHVAIVVFEGFDAMDAIGPFEVFGQARERADLKIGLHAREPGGVVSSHGLRIEPEETLGELGSRPDVLIVPGGGYNDRAEAGVRAQLAGPLPKRVAEHHAAGTLVASVCTGAMVLAAAGLTDGRPAVTHRGALADLRESGAAVREARVVDDGDLVTAGGITAGIDLALHLLERLVGAGVAESVADTMEYERRGEVLTD